MNTITDKLGVVQNTGLFDRLFRVLIGVLMLGGALYHLMTYNVSISWHAYVALLSVYPLMTGMLGWDPFYSAGRMKTCGLSEKNQCGTLPYQIDAAMGHHPVPDHEYDHSLTGSHH